jgi:3-methyl-2-oxobutanoate hydroxymethyltransferase
MHHHVSLSHLKAHRASGTRFSMVTAYDACFAQLASDAGIDSLLVGDSLGMVLQGHDSTLPVTLKQMVYHTACVTRTKPRAFVIADMPFMAAATLEDTMRSARLLMQAGAQMIKLEGGAQLLGQVQRLADQGVPVCCHLGLTPQFVNRFGGYKVQGRTQAIADQLVADAQALDAAGADMLLLECVPNHVTARIMAVTQAPVVGIGAGPETTAQVLVLHDLLGITPGKPARFVQNFLSGSASIQAALSAFDQAVKSGAYPAPEHCFVD